MNRRQFNKLAGLGLAALATRSSSGATSAPRADRKRPKVNFFSKHLQFLDYDEMSSVAAELGFDGLDLTVRPGGHVLPERVKEDLPRATAAMRAHGLVPTMMTTALASAASPHADDVLRTAAAEGIRYYRTQWFRFKDNASWRESMDACREENRSLAALNARYGMHGAYQNHAGPYVGSYVSDIAYLLDGVDPRWMGAQYDIRHATVEGGTAWPLGLRLLRPHIRTIVLKDFAWEQGRGSLKLLNVPLGDGVVDFKRYFKLLREYGMDPVISLHSEYDLGGATNGHRTITIPRADVLAAYRRDLVSVERLWAESFD